MCLLLVCRRFSKHHLARILHVAQYSSPCTATEDPFQSSVPAAPLLRLEAMQRVQRNTSPVKHSAGLPSAAARFGSTAADLRIVFLPPPPVTPARAATAAEPSVAVGAVGTDGAAAAPAVGSLPVDVKSSEQRGGEGEGGMLWRTQEFERRLLEMASLPQPPVSSSLHSRMQPVVPSSMVAASGFQQS